MADTNTDNSVVLKNVKIKEKIDTYTNWFLINNWAEIYPEAGEKYLIIINDIFEQTWSGLPSGVYSKTGLPSSGADDRKSLADLPWDHNIDKINTSINSLTSYINPPIDTKWTGNDKASLKIILPNIYNKNITSYGSILITSEFGDSYILNIVNIPKFICTQISYAQTINESGLVINPNSISSLHYVIDSDNNLYLRISSSYDEFKYSASILSQRAYQTSEPDITYKISLEAVDGALPSGDGIFYWPIPLYNPPALMLDENNNLTFNSNQVITSDHLATEDQDGLLSKDDYKSLQSLISSRINVITSTELPPDDTEEGTLAIIVEE